MGDLDELPIEEDMPELVEEGEESGNKEASTSKVVLDPNDFQQPKTRKRRAKSEAEGMEGVEAIEAILKVGGKRRKSDGETRKVPVPNNRYTPLKEAWLNIFTPIVEQLNLQVRFNLKSRCVEIRRSSRSVDVGNLQKAVDFVTAFVAGFSAEDAVALIRLDDLFVETFEVGDVKPLKGDHLSRAIGRLAGKDGRTKFTIENITKTRIVLANSKISILGSFRNIAIARSAISSLIMGRSFVTISLTSAWRSG